MHPRRDHHLKTHWLESAQSRSNTSHMHKYTHKYTHASAHTHIIHTQTHLRAHTLAHVGPGTGHRALKQATAVATAQARAGQGGVSIVQADAGTYNPCTLGAGLTLKKMRVVLLQRIIKLEHFQSMCKHVRRRRPLFWGSRIHPVRPGATPRLLSLCTRHAKED